MIDMHAHQLFADGLDQQRRDDRRINAPGQRKQHLFIPDLTPDQFDLVGNEVFHIPICFRMASVKQERIHDRSHHVFLCRPLIKAMLTLGRRIIHRQHRDACIIDKITNFNRLAVDDVQRAAVKDDPLDIIQLCQFFFRDIMRFDLAVDAQITDHPRQYGIFIAA